MMNNTNQHVVIVDSSSTIIFFYIIIIILLILLCLLPRSEESWTRLPFLLSYRPDSWKLLDEGLERGIVYVFTIVPQEHDKNSKSIFYAEY